MPDSTDERIRELSKLEIEDEEAENERLEKAMSRFESRVGQLEKKADDLEKPFKPLSKEQKVANLKDELMKHKVSKIKKAIGMDPGGDPANPFPGVPKAGPFPGPTLKPIGVPAPARIILPGQQPGDHEMKFMVRRDGAKVEMQFTAPVTQVAFDGNAAIDLGNKLIEYGRKANKCITPLTPVPGAVKK